MDYQTELLWIVDDENGYIYQDDFQIDASTIGRCSLMLGNKMRSDGYNEVEKRYKKSNKSAVKCQMNCHHWTGNLENFIII